MDGPLVVDNTRREGGRHRGLVYVAASSVLFGCVAAAVKFLALPPVLFLLWRSLIQWLLSLGVLWGLRKRGGFAGIDTITLMWAPRKVRLVVFARALAFFLFLLLWCVVFPA